MRAPSLLAGGVAVALLLGAGCATEKPEPEPVDCPVCRKPLADGPEVRVIADGESGRGRRYRCFMCPLVEGRPEARWTMRARSAVDGRWVVFGVEDGRVSSEPPSAVVLNLPVGPGAECLEVHRVFVDEDEFRRYAAAHPAVGAATPRRFEDVLLEANR